MPIIRRVFGPFNPEEQTDVADPTLRWYFNGIRDDHTVGHWVLVYEINKRTFRAQAITINDTITGRSMRVLHAAKVSPLPSKEVKHPEMFLDDRPVLQGTVTQILRSKLSASEIARASAASILKRK